MPVQWAGLAPPLLVDVRRDAGLPLRAQLEGGSARRDPLGPPPGRRAAAVLPRARPPAGALPRARAGVLRPAAGRGLPHQRRRVGHAGGGGRGIASAAPAAQSSHGPTPLRHPTATADRLRLRRARPRRVPPRGLGVGGARGLPHGRGRRTSTTATPAATRGCARCWRATRAGCARRSPTATACVVCSGFAQGATLVLRTLARAGYRRIALENPGNGDPARSASSRAALRIGGELHHVPVDEHGVDVDALAASGAQVVVVTPAHQSPTGVVLTAERRHALVAWARDTDGFVVEDDYDSEFRYDRDPVGVLQGLAPERVFTVGTVSKSLAPTIRVGWVLAPPAFAAALAEEKHLADRGTPGLDQARARPPGGVRPLRPPPAPDAGPLRPAPHRAGRRARPARPRRCGSPGWPPGSTPWRTCRTGSTSRTSSPRRPERGVGLYGMSALPRGRRHHPAAARARVRQPRRPGGGRGHRHGRRPPEPRDDRTDGHDAAAAASQSSGTPSRPSPVRPASVSTTTRRLPVRRIHPMANRRSVSAVPSGPARWWRCSDQSRQ